MDQAVRIGRLFVTGITMGIIHVLTGPDHLSALATLSANVSDKNAFYVGAQWGIGHSIGLVCVAIILISLDNSDEDNEDGLKVSNKLQSIFESIVGVLMIFLGFYGINSTRRKHSNRPIIEISSPDEEKNAQGLDISIKDDFQSGTLHFEIEPNLDKSREEKLPDLDPDNSQTHIPGEINISHGHNYNDPSAHSHTHGHLYEYFFHVVIPCGKGPVKQRGIATIVGIIHGIAGPGGVLGVIPAVRLHNWLLALIYLTTFCLTSIITMGCFARSYGLITKKLSGKLPPWRLLVLFLQLIRFIFHRDVIDKGNMEYTIELLSSTLSIIVGVLWLTLIYFGVLDDVFP